VEFSCNDFQSGINHRRGLRNPRVRLGVVALFLSLALFSGCSRDPNVRKHKYLESGQRFAEQGKYREAVIQFSNAVKIDKNFADAYYARSQAYTHLGAFSSAFNDLRRTVILQPANYKARVDLGNILLAGNQPDQAKVQADAAVAAQPNNPDVHELLSHIAEKRGDKDLAMTEIQRALQLAPNQASLHESLAMLEAGSATMSS
jgi:Tfp pilus assembly protein PilF